MEDVTGMTVKLKINTFFFFLWMSLTFALDGTGLVQLIEVRKG